MKVVTIIGDGGEYFGRVWIDYSIGVGEPYRPTLYYRVGGWVVGMEIGYGADIGEIYARLGEISEWVARKYGGATYRYYLIQEDEMDLRYKSMGIDCIFVDGGWYRSGL